MKKQKTQPKLIFTERDFKKTLIDSRGFQFNDLRLNAKRKYNKFMKKYGDKIKISPTGNPGITLTA